MTIKAAAKRANLSREYLSRALRKDHVRAYIEEKTRSALAIATLRAVARLNELLDAKNEAVAAKATFYLFGLAGLAPVDANAKRTEVSVAVTPGHVLTNRSLGRAIVP